MTEPPPSPELPLASTVAVVDDDPDLLSLVRVILSTAGLQVQTFTRAADMFGALEDGAQFDLVLSDVDMPEWDGIQLVEAIRRRTTTLPVILLSARSGEEELLRGLEAGANDYIVKPASPAVIRAKVRYALRQLRAGTDASLAPDPELPCRLGGYELTVELGRGGFGVVYGGADEEGTPVALKLLFAEVCRDTELVTRYLREVDALRALRAPHVVRYIDSGVAGGRHFLVMERVPGISAQARLERDGPLPAAEVLAIGAQLAETLVALGDAGLVHRDIKPGNVILSPDGSATLVDFGLAKPEQDHALTASRDLLGSAPFIAPEVIRGERPAWIGSDVYALGATLYTLLTGQAPHDGEDREDDYDILRAAAQAREPLRLASLPPILAQTVGLLLHPDPTRRLSDPRQARTQLKLASRAAANLSRED